MILPLLGALLGSAPSFAGTGPWVVGEGQLDLYTGVDAQRFDTLAVSTGTYADADLIEVDDGVSKLAAKAIFTYGLLSNTEIDLQVPWMYVRANREDGPLCGAVGLSACETTRGLGIISGHLRYNPLNELYGAPVSLSVGLEARAGDLTSPTRARITNLGEGTFDLGPQLSVGRSGGLGESGYWYGLLDGGWRYRFPLDHDGDTAIPGSEWYGEVDWIAVPGGVVGFGPSVLFFSRPQGVDFEQVDLGDIDRFSSLRVLAIQGGGKLTIRSSRQVSLSMSAFYTIYAENNPAVLTLSTGLSINDLIRNKKGGE